MKRVLVLILCMMSVAFADITWTTVGNVTGSFTAGDSQELKFFMTYDDGGEPMDGVCGISLQFPQDITIDSIPNITDGSGRVLSLTSSSNNKVIWGDTVSGFNEEYLQASAGFSVFVTIPDSYTENMQIHWLAMGNLSSSDDDFVDGYLYINYNSQLPSLESINLVRFEDIPIDVKSSQTIEIMNVGTGSAVINESDIILHDDGLKNVEGFSYEGNDFPFTIPPGESVNFSLSFTPADTLDYFANLKIYATPTDYASISLHGNGYLPSTIIGESFENGDNSIPDTWQAIDYDGDGNSFTIKHNDDINGSAHDGSKVIANQSNTSKTDDWLISPRISVSENSNILSFHAKAMEDGNSDFTEDFNLRIYNDNEYNVMPDSSDFKIVKRYSQTGREWKEYKVDLSEYSGQNIEIAWQHVSENQSFLLIDDIKVEEGVGIEDDNTVKDFSILSNYPNPFNPSTNINFSLSNDSKASVIIYNSKGEIIDTITKNFRAGKNSVRFNGTDRTSGIYFFRVKTESKMSSVKKMVLIK